jgi:hypothetical protein
LPIQLQLGDGIAGVVLAGCALLLTACCSVHEGLSALHMFVLHGVVCVCVRLRMCVLMVCGFAGVMLCAVLWLQSKEASSVLIGPHESTYGSLRVGPAALLW